MSKEFDQLRRGPQTKLNLGDLKFDERPLVQMIKISSGKGHRPSRKPSGAFTQVYYLPGDEKRAAETFVEINKSEVEAIDLSARNIIQSCVTRPIYDWIRHAAGWCTLEVYDTVIVEERADGQTWVVEGDRYVNNVGRRYTTGEPGSARLEGESLRDLYNRLGNTIDKTALENAGVEGDASQVLEYYRVAPQFSCNPKPHQSTVL